MAAASPAEQELERRALAGEAAAKLELGAVLLTGQRAAADGPRGVASIEEAAAAGHPEAIERTALFEAMGVGRPPSWKRALERLAEAARQGSSRAGAQLLLLADNSRDPDISAPDGDWADLASRISIERLTRLPERRSLSEDPRIRVIEGFATAAECRWLIALGRDRLAPATIFDQASGTLKQDPARTNKGIEFQLLDMDLVTELVRTRISAATRLPLPVFETSQLLHYAVGEEFRPHYDFLDPANDAYRGQFARFGQRVATFLIYLNDGFEGGETEFPKVGIRYRGATGDALFFANVDRAGKPDPLTLHAGVPPTSGEKWIFSQWIRDRSPAQPGA